MKNLHELDNYREPHPWWPQTAKAGSFKVFVKGRSFMVLASVDDTGDDGVWEHISVQMRNQKRCPTWDEMCEIKDMFFGPEEVCIQYHPAKSNYINIQEYCLHIWRPIGGILRDPTPSYARMESLESRDAQLEEWWNLLTDIPMDPDTECIEEEFLHFAPGTNREDIWRWFDERHSKGVAYLLNGDGVDRTEDVASLTYQKILCEDCDAEHCAFNPQGVCLYPMVHGKMPEFTDADGCKGFCYKEDDDDPMQ